jgi:hypothetical protein
MRAVPIDVLTPELALVNPEPPARRRAKPKSRFRDLGYNIARYLSMGEFMQEPAEAQAAFA